MDSYLANQLSKLAFSSQADYQAIIDNRLRPFCGHMHPDDLTGQDVAAYLEMREQSGNGQRGNKEIAVLSSVYNHGMRIRACISNPCRGVRRNPAKPRTFYISDESFRLALRHADTPLRHLLWGAYLTGFRQRDLRSLTQDNVTPEGLEIIQSKDGKHELRLWSDSLRKLVRRSLARSESIYVFTNGRGKQWSLSAVQSAMRRLRAKTGIEWRFHDIRAKAHSDHETGLGLMRRYARAAKRKAVR